MDAQIDPKTWAALSALLDTALDLPPAEREPWIAALDPEHEPLKAPLRALLARQARVETADFLNTLPKLDVGLIALGQDAPAADGDTVGPYRLIAELGSGGMGVVWLAQRSDGLLDRRVALKFPHGAWNRKGLAERMARERALLATLEHPCIARLYDAGVTDTGQPYLALEYVDGQALNVYCARHQLDLRRRLSLFLQMCDAMAYAHSKLIIHRDLKPANILVTAAGEVRLLDFGIAKLLDEQQADARVTQFAGQALTPDYASPEQIAGLPLGVGTDIYSLGVILYELLTEQRPYRLKRDSRGALEDAILQAEPRRPSQAAPPRRARFLRGDLDAIVLKALRKDPRERYVTVHALAEDVRRHLEGHPVVARPDSHVYRVRKFLVRHRLGATGFAVAAAAILGGAGVALWQAEMARSESRRAESVTQFIASIFQGVDPSLVGAARPMTAVAVLEQAERRVGVELQGQPDVQMRLRGVIARSYLGLFEPQRARDVLAVALAAAVDGAERSGATFRSLHQLMAQALVMLMELDEADRHLTFVLDSLAAQSPSAEYVAAKVTQSEIAYRRGAYDTAAEVAEAALAAAEQLVTVDPALLLSVHTALGKAAGMQRRTEDSVAHNRRAFELALETTGADHDHPKVIDTEQNLAASLIDVAKIDEAIPHLERSLEGARTIYGEESLVAGQNAVRLGLVHMERGELAVALELIETGLRIESNYRTGPAASMSGRRRTLGRTHIAARRWHAALPEIEAALEIMRQFDMPFALRVLEADYAFVAAVTSGALTKGIDELEQVIVAQDQGEARYKTHLPDIYRGILQLWAGDIEAALRALERGVDLARAQTRVSDLGEALTFLGHARLEARDVDGAEAVLAEGLERLRSVQVAATPVQAEAWLGLARVALERGEIDAALRLLDDAAQFWMAFAPDNRGSGQTEFWRGRALLAAGRPEEARTSFAAAVRLLEHAPLPADRTLLQAARRQ